MAHEHAPIDITALPDLAPLVEEVRRTGQARVIRRADEDVALLTPLPAMRPARAKRAPAPQDDSLWDLVGIGASDGPEDVAADKHDYLADAALARHEGYEA